MLTKQLIQNMETEGLSSMKTLMSSTVAKTGEGHKI